MSDIKTVRDLYVVIVDDVPYVFSSTKDAENFTFSYKYPQRILRAHDKTRMIETPAEQKGQNHE